VETVLKCHFHDASTALKESLIPHQCSLLNHPCPSFKRRGAWRGIWGGEFGGESGGELGGEFGGNLEGAWRELGGEFGGDLKVPLFRGI